MTTKKACKVTFNFKLCKSCGLCVYFCNRSVLGEDDNGLPEVKQAERCNGCRLCVAHCPDFAIEIGAEG